MFRIPIDDVKLDINNTELFDKYYEIDDIYYCSEFSLYFKGTNLELIGSRRACFGKNANRKKSNKYFNECQKIIDTNNKITDSYQLLLKR